MVSDAMPNACVPALSKESSGKKKKTTRYAKLKQSKLDVRVRREQWLSSGKIADANKNHGLRENLQRRTKEDEHEILITHDSESESLMSSSITSSIGVGSLGKYSFGSGSGSSSSNGFSESASDEEQDDGCLDDWEAIADALTSESSSEEKHPEIENNCSNDSDESDKKSITSTLKESSGVIHWPNTNNNNAWSPDDTSRPRSLPNPPNQHNNRCLQSETIWSWRSLTSQPSCPICCEDFDSTDSSFLPCPCGFRLCLFCHKRILEDDGRCPGCRRQYESVSNDAALGAHKCHATFASIIKISF